MRSLITTFLVVATLATAAFAQAPTPDFQSFFDSRIPAMMERSHVPGMVVTVVKGDSIAFSKAYGYANVEKQIPANAETTMFRVGSISKVFTATAVMQLAEQGKLDFTRDVNDYLTLFKVSPAFGKPVTLANLLTHTAGFDDRYSGKSARSESEAKPLGIFLAGYLPKRIVPPGEVYTYSNLGNALAGYVVEQASGQNFADYVDSHVHHPLGMGHSTWHSRPAPEMAVAYAWRNGRYAPYPLDYLQDAPAGQLAASGNDMGRFMIANLNGGALGDKRILKEESLRELHRVHFQNNATLHNAVAYGWHVIDVRGHEMLIHQGGYLGVSAWLSIFPSDRLGLFIATNSRSAIPEQLFDSFVQQYLPEIANPVSQRYPITISSYDRAVERFVGYYRASRYAHSTFDKVGVLMGMNGPEMRIDSTSDGMLLMPRLSGPPRRMVQIRPLVFQSIDDDYYAAFRQDPDGKITHIFTSGIDSLEKIPWLLTIRVQAILGLLTILMLLIASVSTGIAAWRHRSAQRSPESHYQSSWRNICAWTATANMAFLLAWGIFMLGIGGMDSLQMAFTYGVPPVLYAIQFLSLVFCACTLVLIFKTLFGLRHRTIPLLSRAWYTAITVTAIVSVLWLDYWNLLGWRF